MESRRGWGDGLSTPPVFSIINLKQSDCAVETKKSTFFSPTDCICDGRTWKEVTEGWRKLHDEKLHNLYFSPNVILVYINYQLDALTIIYS